MRVARRPELWLLRGLRIVAAKDSGSFRQAVFDDLTRHRPAVRWARAVHGFLRRSWLSALFVASYGAGSYLAVAPPVRRAAIWAVGAYRNEARQFDWMGRLLPSGTIGRVRIDAFAGATALLAAVRALGSPRAFRRCLRIVRRYDRRHDFLVSCRVASTLAYYLRFRLLLAACPPRATLVSTDSNPYGIGLAFAGKSIGVPAIYVPHGHIPDGPPRLHFDLSLLDGEAIAQVYRESGGIEGEVVYKGAEGEYRPMRTGGLRRGLHVGGVFLSLLVDWPRLARVLAEIQRSLAPTRLLLRFHPNELVRPRGALEKLGRWNNLVVSYGERILLDDAADCDLVIAGNTSCHLTLLKYGVPTVYVDGLDAVPRDFYGFLRHRIVPACERPDQIHPSKIADFYEDPDWKRRFAFFDASYESDADEGRVVRAAISQLVHEVAS